MSVSAKGLFRATGKSAKSVHVRDLVSGDIILTDSLEREKDDFYPTPPEPTRALLAAELVRMKDFPSIWECAAGDGAMAREMETLGFDVCKTDLVDRGCGASIASFYDFETPLSTAIVTNPPFQECNSGEWIKHALGKLGVEYMALLLPVNWMGAMTRGPLWEKYKPARVYLMRWRIDFTGQGAPPMLNAWYIWDKKQEGETILRMMDRDDARQGKLFA